MNRTVFAFLAVTLCLSLQASAIASSASKPEKIDDVNAAVVAARTATKDKRYGTLKPSCSRSQALDPS